MERTGDDVLADAKKQIEIAKAAKAKAAEAKIHDYGYGFGCNQEPKNIWIPSKFAADAEKTWKDAGKASLDEFYECLVGDFYRRYQKRHLLRTNGVHWDTDILVADAGIPECNGRYVLDKKFMWRSKPVWHHERGACDSQWDGRGGGATIVYDMRGNLNKDNGGSCWLLFYKGGPRYMNAQGDCHMNAPTGTWSLCYEGHTFDGLVTEGAAPSTRCPAWSSWMASALKKEAEEEAGVDDAAGDYWIVDLEDKSSAESQNWVIKCQLEQEPSSGGLFGCCMPASGKLVGLALTKDKELMLDKILDASVGGGVHGPLSQTLSVKGALGKSNKTVGISMARLDNPEAARDFIKSKVARLKEEAA